MSGVLTVVGTPIGNLDDLSPRAARAIADADVLACEDTRVARVLLQRVAVMAGVRPRGRLLATHGHNERRRADELVRAVAGGARVVLTTDAGMPGLSDPGHRVVAACRDAGLRVEVIPGPSAVITGLVASGLPSARFVFDGFLPRTATARRRRLETLAREERTIVVFEAPHRVARTLTDAAAILGERPAALTRELTKVHEEVLQGTLPELAAMVATSPPRGEITIVIAGTGDRGVAAEIRPEQLVRDVAGRVAGGATRRDAIAAVAVERDLPRKVVYQAVIDADGR